MKRRGQNGAATGAGARTSAVWHVHKQNLNERRRPDGHGADGVGPLWRYGRCWLHWYSHDPDEMTKDTYRPYRHVVVGLSWKVPSRHVGVGVTIHNTDEDDVSAYVGVGLVSLWLSVEGIFPRGWRYRKDAHGHYRGDRETSLRVHNGGVWWNVWHDDDDWRSTEPKWRRGSWQPLDTLLGHRRYSVQVIDRVPVNVPLPEGTYPADLTFSRARWTWPRWPHWPFVTEIARCQADFPTPLPIPGKGENSWDMDDDAYHSMTFPASRVEQAVGEIVASVLEARRRHGGSMDWQPETQAAETAPPGGQG